MPRRSILVATERENLLALPNAKDELIRHYMAELATEKKCRNETKIG